MSISLGLQILCIMIKIIEYVLESFCSFRKQETTGHLILELKFFWLEMHITSMMWLFIHLTEKDC